jgi:signal peptidase I
MFSSITDTLLTSVSDMTQNPVSLTIFGILSLIIVSLFIAIFSPKTRDVLISAKILEEDEAPSSLLIWIIGIIIIVKLVQAFLIQPFIVDGASMLPTYHNEEFLLVDKLSYRITSPERGDITIFKLYENVNNPYEGKYLIKRIIGLSGERVVVRNGVTTIYTSQKPEGFILNMFPTKSSQKMLTLHLMTIISLSWEITVLKVTIVVIGDLLMNATSKDKYSFESIRLSR